MGRTLLMQWELGRRDVVACDVIGIDCSEILMNQSTLFYFVLLGVRKMEWGFEESFRMRTLLRGLRRGCHFSSSFYFTLNSVKCEG
jgi:hypothetical protein